MSKNFVKYFFVWSLSVLILAGGLILIQKSGLFPQLFPETAKANPDCTVGDNLVVTGNLSLSSVSEGIVSGLFADIDCKWKIVGNIGAGRTCFATAAGIDDAAGYEVRYQYCRYNKASGDISGYVQETGCDEAGNYYLACEYVCFD